MSQFPGISMYGQSPSGVRPTPIPGLELFMDPQMAQGVSRLAGMFMYPGNDIRSRDPFGSHFSVGGTANTGLSFQQKLEIRQQNAIKAIKARREAAKTVSPDVDRLAAALENFGVSSGAKAKVEAEMLLKTGNMLIPELQRLAPGLADQILQFAAPEKHFRFTSMPRIAANTGASADELSSLNRVMMSRLLDDNVNFDPKMTLGFGPGGFMRTHQRLTAQGMISPFPTVSNTGLTPDTLEVTPTNEEGEVTGATVDINSGRRTINSSIDATQQVMQTLASARTLPGMQNATTGQLQGVVQSITGGGLGNVDANTIQQDVDKFREVQKATEISLDAMIKFVKGAQQMARKIGVSEVSASRSAVESLLSGQQAAQATAALFNNSMDTVSVERNAGKLASAELRSRMSGLNSNFNRRIASTGEVLRQRLGGTDEALARLDEMAGEGNDVAGALGAALRGDELSEERLELLHRNDSGMVDLITSETGMSPSQAYRIVQSADYASRGNTSFDGSVRAVRQQQIRSSFRGQEDKLRKTLEDMDIEEDISLRQLAGASLAAVESKDSLAAFLSEEFGVNATSDQLDSFLNEDFILRLGDKEGLRTQMQLGLSFQQSDKRLSEIEAASEEDLKKRQAGISSFGTRLSNIITGGDVTPAEAVDRLGGREAALRGIAHGNASLNDMVKNPEQREKLFELLGLSNEERGLIESAGETKDQVAKFRSVASKKLMKMVGREGGGEMIAAIQEAIMGKIGAEGAGEGAADDSLMGYVNQIQKNIKTLTEYLVGGALRVNTETGEVTVTEDSASE